MLPTISKSMQRPKGKCQRACASPSSQHSASAIKTREGEWFWIVIVGWIGSDWIFFFLLLLLRALLYTFVHLFYILPYAPREAGRLWYRFLKMGAHGTFVVCARGGAVAVSRPVEIINSRLLFKRRRARCAPTSSYLASSWRDIYASRL